MTDEISTPEIELGDRVKRIPLSKTKKKSTSSDELAKAKKRATAAEKRADALEKKLLAAEKKIDALERKLKSAKSRKTTKSSKTTKTPRKRKSSSQGSGAADLLGKLADGISTEDVVDLISSQFKKDK